MTTVVELSVELHQALMGLASGEIPFYVVRCPPSLARSFIHVLICIENGIEVPVAEAQLGMPSTLVDKTAKNLPAYKVKQASYQAFSACLDAFGLGALRSLLQVAVDERKGKPKRGRGKANPQKSQRLYRSIASSNIDPGASLVYLRKDDRADTAQSTNERRGIVERLRDRARFNEILSHLQQHGCTAQDACTLAALLIVVVLPKPPRNELVLQDAGYFSLPDCDGALYEPMTLDELAVWEQIGDIVRREAEWKTKIQQDAIIKKWRQQLVDTHGFTPGMAAYLLDELRWMATLPFAASAQPTGAPGVFYRSGSLDDAAVAELRDAVDRFAGSVSDASLGCCPDCSSFSSQLSFLVDPSMYALTDYTHLQPKQRTVARKLSTRAREYLEELRPSLAAGPDHDSAVGDIQPPYPLTSGTTQSLTPPSTRAVKGAIWIPAEVRTSKAGTRASFLSYINGLSPFDDASRQLYGPIARALAAMLPLFEATLAFSPLRGDTAFLKDVRKSKQRKRPVQPRNDAGRPPSSSAPAANTSAKSRWRPTVRQFVPPPLRKVNLCGKELQVVVRLIRADLAPNAPEKQGEDWHFQGMPYESICARGIYYLDCDNVLPPTSFFRVAVDEDSMEAAKYRHLKDHQLEDLFGFSVDDAYACYPQEIGSVTPEPGACFTYPAMAARSSSSLKLCDPSKPGHLTILEISLVDPARPMLSSSHVVPQQVDWLRDATLQLTDQDPRCRLNRLPREVVFRIFAHLDSVLQRDELQDSDGSAERTSFTISRNAALERRRLDLKERVAENERIDAAYEHFRGHVLDAFDLFEPSDDYLYDDDSDFEPDYDDFARVLDQLSLGGPVYVIPSAGSAHSRQGGGIVRIA
ncbi:uncharacterized protein PFL1_05570 [Pseudozyma flocculosa PF-1]|uniref:DUF4246 domain-containing protein n=2 Tax=Pseudozyma flocculosa TaxID=84751 RepID=A0A5C3FAN5_9BASI|nr:uncharacterized protein PFL1_05570 [Pseudozyma flocculosa PF-1]EPQ26936.1 hypothetical protein PFL1_05570 [Pseudozyma flocculosa PF-1]SPO41156.1 uncharacterized protein PSFLO_06638 [Pseudozyma flocculosa]